MHIALVTVGYNFSLLVVQGIKCVINFFFQKKRRRNLCVVNQNIVSKFNWISYIVPWMNRNYACMLTIAVGFWWSCRICKRVMGLEKITTDQTRIWSWSPINSTQVITFDLVLLSQFCPLNDLKFHPGSRYFLWQGLTCQFQEMAWHPV